MNFVSAALLFISTVFLEFGSVFSTCSPSPVGYIVQSGYATTPTTGCGQSYPIVQTVYSGSSGVPVYSGYTGTSTSQAQAAALAQSASSGYSGSSGFPLYSGSSSQAQASALAQSAGSGSLAQAQAQANAQASGSGVTVLTPSLVHQTSSNSANWQTGALTTWQKTFHGMQPVPTTTTTTCYTGCV